MENVCIKLKKGNFFGRENIEQAIKRFKAKLDSEEIMDIVRSKRSFETPKQKKIRKLKKMHKRIKEFKNSLQKN